MTSNSNAETETLELAERLLAVLDYVIKITELRLPEDMAEALNLSQIRTIYLLRFEPGISQKEIADRLGLTPAAISKLVREMEQNGFVVREPDASDARQMKLWLSEYGRTAFEQGEGMRRDGVARMLNSLSIDEQRLIVELLERALAVSRAGNGQPHLDT